MNFRWQNLILFKFKLKKCVLLVSWLSRSKMLPSRFIEKGHTLSQSHRSKKVTKNQWNFLQISLQRNRICKIFTWYQETLSLPLSMCADFWKDTKKLRFRENKLKVNREGLWKFKIYLYIQYMINFAHEHLNKWLLSDHCTGFSCMSYFAFVPSC